MSKQNQEQSSREGVKFNVRFGRLAATVDERDEQEAIRAARRQWSLEKPHLWELIAELEPERFQVNRAA